MSVTDRPSEVKNVEGFYFTRNHIQHPQITIGEYTYGLPTIAIPPNVYCTIGNFCSIGTNVSISMINNHRTDWVSTYPFALLPTLFPEAGHLRDDARRTKGSVTIGNDVWIGNNVQILPGVTIGDGAVIGASAVIPKDVAPYAVVVGNPGREVKKRFSDEAIGTLLTIKWWDWPIEKIQQYAPLLASDNIEDFLSAAEA